MPKQSSLIRLEGKMDGISFYKRKGSFYAKRATGPSKERILTDPKFKRTRENLTEFQALGQASRVFKRALRPVSNFTDGDMRNRMMKVFRRINKLSEGPRGQRPVHFSQNRNVLKGLQLHPTNVFEDVCEARITVTHKADRTGCTVTIPSLQTGEMIKAPVNATHFRIAQLITAIPDIVYDTTSDKYKPSDVFFENLSEIKFSEYFTVSTTEPVTITLETLFVNVPPLPEHVSVLQGVGIIFYELVGDIQYPLNDGLAMSIADVF
ncbi:hypothetical protein [Chryseosolibacter indicus]|uniref:Uncharacterized protein n=1 Tax=Chryseosolibacter indicus TaxID=2782351 RepID=A0ABS5VPS0_9BACT|nr:hypothetical protein [Chryseosolibacter indicus]MBT1702845.1 hypothetical protein [Chryseosolibacter indicus]